jgi:hypothetical protein
MEVVHTGAGSRSRRRSGGTYVEKPGRHAGAGKHLVRWRLTGKYLEYSLVEPTVFHFEACLFSSDAKRGERATKMLATNERRFDCQ